MKTMLGSLAVAVLLGSAASAAPPSLRFIGLQTLPQTATFAGTAIGGLSGIDYDAATDRYTAISDDRSQINPARFYDFKLDYSSTAFTGVTPVRTTVIQRPDGTPYPALGLDPESIRKTAAGTYVWSSEGDATQLQNPSVREMNADGSYVRDLAIPAKYNPTADNSSGIRNNLAFESLAFTPDGSLFTATESALNQDGPAATPTNGATARILKFDGPGVAGAEYAYQIDPVAQSPVPANQFFVNGVTELLALSNSSFIAVERSFSVGAGYVIKLYQIDLTGASDVSGIASLTSGGYTPVTKTLIANLDDLGFAIDNIEGVTFGKTLENGRRSLVLVADNNFTPGLATQVLAFEVGGVPEPATWALMLVGFGAVGATMRRRTLPVVAA